MALLPNQILFSTLSRTAAFSIIMEINMPGMLAEASRIMLHYWLSADRFSVTVSDGMIVKPENENMNKVEK